MNGEETNTHSVPHADHWGPKATDFVRRNHGSTSQPRVLPIYSLGNMVRNLTKCPHLVFVIMGM